LFNTVVKSQLHFGKNPWKDVAISGFVTLKGEKMSKSKGNIIRPQEVMEKYGADALRYWAASSKLGEDFDYQEKDVVTGKKFVTKLLNATKFVFMNLEDWKGKKPKKLEALDELFLNKLDFVVNEVGKNFEKYEYSRAKQEADNFFWKDFCDNYLEIVKKRVYRGEGEKKLSAQYTLYKSLLTILKLFAPFTPFITEELYQTYFKKREKYKSIHLSEWPKISITRIDNFNWNTGWKPFVEILSKVRQEKTKAQKPMNVEIKLTLDKSDYALMEMGLLEDLKNVTNAKEIKEGKFNVEFI